MDPRRSARRLRRRLRAGLTALVLGAIAVTGAVAVLPAQAATPSPKVELVSGDRAITAAWSAVPGAGSYTVRLSRTRSLSHARVVRTTTRSVKLTKVKNGTTYYVAVTANRAAATAGALFSASTARSSVVEARAAAGVPFRVSKVTVRSGPSANQVTVGWTGGGRMNKVAVVAGSSVLTNERTFHSAWYPSTTRSVTITVPTKYRQYMGAGTGNPVWVKVVESNATSSAFGASYSSARKYRPSPPGTWAFAKDTTPAAAVDKLVVAELNTQTVEATAKFTAHDRWAARAPRVAAAIELADPDLLLTAELSTGLVRTGCVNSVAKNTFPCEADTQYRDLANRLPDLKLADGDAYQRVIEAMRMSSTFNGATTSGAHIFYNPDKLTLEDHGFYSPAGTRDFADVEGLGVSPWNPRSAVGVDRWLSWAKFRIAGSGREFYAVAAHLPVGSSSLVAGTRVQEVTKLIAAIQRRAGNLPIVFGGDMNSDAVRNAQPTQPVFMRAGWFDAAAVPSKHLRTGMKVSTANGSGAQDGADPGYGSKPVSHPYETSRIDYILLKNSPYTYRYANVLRLHANGTFIKSLQGTDHNMQLATIGIGDPVPAS